MRGPIVVGLGAGVLLALSGCFLTADPVSTASPEPTVTVTVTATPTPSATATPVPTETVAPTETPVPTPTATTPGKANVTVKITQSDIEDDLNQLHIGVQMTGISEEDGTCTATATRKGKSVTVTQQAIYNVNRTECGGLRFSLNDLSSGTWKVAVAYASPKYTGLSQTISVKVP
jgi:hypothetical protein